MASKPRSSFKVSMGDVSRNQEILFEKNLLKLGSATYSAQSIDGVDKIEIEITHTSNYPDWISKVATVFLIGAVLVGLILMIFDTSGFFLGLIIFVVAAFFLWYYLPQSQRYYGVLLELRSGKKVFFTNNKRERDRLISVVQDFLQNKSVDRSITIVGSTVTGVLKTGDGNDDIQFIAR